MAKYFTKAQGSEAGPFTSGQLRSMATAGELSRDSLIRKDGTDSWFRAATAKGLWPETAVGLAEPEPEIDPLVHAAGKAIGATANMAKAAGGAILGMIPKKGSKESLPTVNISSAVPALVKRFTNEEQDPAVTQQILDRVNGILMDGEEILYIAIQAKPVINIAPDAAVLTNRRFIMYHPKMLGRVQFDDYPWIDLVDARLEENILGATIFLKPTSGVELSLSHLPKAQARQLYRHAQEQEHNALELRRQRKMEESRAAAGGGITIQNAAPVAVPISVNTPPADNPMVRLKQLKEMLDADLISQQEYDAKKAEILSRM